MESPASLGVCWKCLARGELQVLVPPEDAKGIPRVWLIKLQAQIQSTVGEVVDLGAIFATAAVAARQPGPSQRPALWEATPETRTWERSRVTN